MRLLVELPKAIVPFPEIACVPGNSNWVYVEPFAMPMTKVPLSVIPPVIVAESKPLP